MSNPLPVANPGAVPVGTLVQETASPADGALEVHIAGGTVTDAALAVAAPTPATATVVTASVTLPASGAMETTPSGAGAGIAVPVGTVGSPITGGTFTVTYTQGTTGGQEAGLVWGWNGIRWGILMGPGDPYVDAVFTGVPLGVGTGVYELPFTIPKGISRVDYTGQEKGVTGTPGTHIVEGSFS